MSEDCHASNNAEEYPQFDHQRRLREMMAQGDRIPVALSLREFQLLDRLVNDEISRICKESPAKLSDVPEPNGADTALLREMGIRW